MSNYKFKKGDRVRVVGQDEYFRLLGIQLNEGNEGVVDEDNSRIPYIKFNDIDYRITCDQDYLELIEPEGYTKLHPKEGDKFRVLKDMPGEDSYGQCPVGTTVIVDTEYLKKNNSETHPFWARCSNGNTYHVAARDLTTEYLEPVEEEEEKKGWDTFTISQEEYAARAVYISDAYTPDKPIKQSIIKKTMNTFKKALLSADTKTLIKAGYMYDESLTLTHDGKEALNFILFEANKKALIDSAKEVIKENEAK